MPPSPRRRRVEAASPPAAIARLSGQRLGAPARGRPAEVVRDLLALQAQDYYGCLWAVGVRSPGLVVADVERDLASGALVRIHAMRCTIQLVAREDVRWVLAAVAPRVVAGMAGRLRQLDLDDRTIGRAGEVLAREVEGGRARTRAELGGALADAGISPAGQRLAHLLARLELAGILTSGPRRGAQQTFAALAERVPAAPALDPAAARGELVRRYLLGRAPASERDAAWWTGLPLGEVRAAIAALGPAVRARDGLVWREDQEPSGPRARRVAGEPEAHLLPAFDELLVGYADRSAMLAPAHAHQINAGGGLLHPCIVVDGRVIGRWRRTLAGDAVAIELARFGRWPRGAVAAVERAASRYAGFLGRSARVSRAGSVPWAAQVHPRH